MRKAIKYRLHSQSQSNEITIDSKRIFFLRNSQVMWKLNGTFLNNEWFKEKSGRKRRKPSGWMKIMTKFWLAQSESQLRHFLFRLRWGTQIRFSRAALQTQRFCPGQVMPVFIIVSTIQEHLLGGWVSRHPKSSHRYKRQSSMPR